MKIQNRLFLPLCVLTLTCGLTIPSAQAVIVLGNGAGALLKSDLTDPENDGIDSAEDATGNGLFNAVFFSSSESTFSNATVGGPSEAAFDVFDNKVGGGEAKWCCEGAPISVGADFNGKQFLLSHFTITNGNDSAPARDLDIWSIQGSNDGTSWTPIFSYNNDGTSSWTAADGDNNVSEVLLYKGALAPGSLPAGAADFGTPSAFNRFRLLGQSAQGGTATHLGELELFGLTQPQLASNPGNGATIDMGVVASGDPATMQLELSNTGTTNLSEIDLISYAITGSDAAEFSLTGFTPTAVGFHGTAAAGDGLLSDGAGNALNTALLDVNFLGGGEDRLYTALLEITTRDDLGNFSTLSFPLQATVVPEPGTLVLLGLGSLALGVVVRRRRRTPHDS